MLRDGRKLVGTLRSFDQYGALSSQLLILITTVVANLVLQDTVERIFAGKHYADIPRGIFLVRGENLVMLAEIDADREHHLLHSRQMQPVSVDQVIEEQEAEMELKERQRNAIERAIAYCGSMEEMESEAY